MMMQVERQTKERPILFNSEMVLGVLDGLKTQTRRVIKPRHDWYIDQDGTGRDWPYYQPYVYADPEGVPVSCPYGEPGDRLWVRETWRDVPVTAYRASIGVQQTPSPEDPDMAAVYKAGGDRSRPSRWRPSIHMPRWASRITLEITDVRAQLLSTISTADCWAEGVPSSPDVNPIHEYIDLWESLYGPGSWQTYPWVWAIDFRRIDTEAAP